MADVKEIMLGDFPVRPGVGKSGRPVQLATNFYEVTQFPDQDIHHYDVEFVPELPIRIQGEIFNRAYAENKEALFGDLQVAYDGRKNIYVSRALGWQENTMNLTVGRKGFEKTWKIVMKKAAVVSMEAIRAYIRGQSNVRPMDSIQALDIIMRQGPSKKLIQVGRSFYTGRDASPISDGAEVWIGYQQSIRPAQGKLLLNVDISCTAFVASQPILDIVNGELKVRLEEMAKRGQSLKREDISRINRRLKNVRVVVTHANNDRSYPCNGLAEETANNKTFTQEDGSTLSVAQYFASKYGMKLRYPDLPLLHVGPKKKDIYIPIEVCKVEAGQRLTKKLNPRQTADMIKITAKKPRDRMKAIEDGVRQLVDPADEYANHFGIKVNKQMMKVPGRILDPPTLVYAKSGREPKIRPNQGSWMIKNSHYYEAASLKHWGIVCFEGEKFMPSMDVGAFVKVLLRSAGEVGMKVETQRPPFVYGNARRIGEIEKTIKNVYGEVVQKTGGHPQLLLFILPRQDSAVYGEIKRVCDTLADVPSQCVLVKHVKKKQPMYCKNVLLKINVKLGGRNSIIERNPFSDFYLSCPAMILGADVTHAAPRSTLPSIAAVVASMDALAYTYGTAIRAQTTRTEVIEELESMVRELLIGFYTNTRRKPEKILFYRDGVSEGQFAQVRDFEITAIRAACQSLEAGYLPAITFVVVQKRHHARFFPMNPRDGDKSGNAQAGTVIDSVITHPTEFDFYLNSHAGLQGTSRPCHYHVLWDENRFTPDILQNFTYRLCYSYARCTKSVSIVPPAYYAHLVAYRARFHAPGDIYADDESVLSGESERSEIIFAQVKAKTKKVMYFM